MKGYFVVDFYVSLLNVVRLGNGIYYGKDMYVFGGVWFDVFCLVEWIVCWEWKEKYKEVKDGVGVGSGWGWFGGSGGMLGGWCVCGLLWKLIEGGRGGVVYDFCSRGMEVF